MATTYTTTTPATNANDIRVMAGCNDALLAVGRIALAVIFLMSASRNSQTFPALPP